MSRTKMGGVECHFRVLCCFNEVKRTWLGWVIHIYKFKNGLAITVRPAFRGCCHTYFCFKGALQLLKHY